ncbi:transcriptional regulator [Treponema parvum]|uniref:Transcriptional regulator n=1 Tax=Treponema parvum TaxID=138851 RepID=A0A975EZ81_9SPIR|nr:P-II family nitrogen regulator [Treponema parvum]QTQ11528.1 transcriptional regulator [Treponema parvum]
MTSYNLMVCIVPHDGGEFIIKAACSAGAGGGTVVMGRGISENRFLHVLALGETSKDIVYMLVPSEERSKIADAIARASERKKKRFGVLFSLDSIRLIKTGNIFGGDDYMTFNAAHHMVSIIANRGYADDIMAAARKAGAGGGTVIKARGTAKPGDAKFFGMEIVPEKEMLLMIIDSEKLDDVLEAVRTLPCLASPGSGIAFCCPISDFMLLGKK